MNMSRLENKDVVMLNKLLRLSFEDELKAINSMSVNTKNLDAIQIVEIALKQYEK